MNQTTFHRWSSLRTELLWIYDGEIAAGTLKEEVDHTSGYWIWLIRKGSVRVHDGDKVWEATAGQWMISPQKILIQEFSPDANILSIHFICRWPDGEDLYRVNEALIFESKSHPRLAAEGTSLCRLVKRHFPGVKLGFSVQALEYKVFLKFQRAFGQFLIQFHDVWNDEGGEVIQAGDGDSRIARVVQMLNESTFEDMFPGDRLQQESGLGRAHLDRLFFGEFGVTTREYWNRLRDETARRLLQDKQMSIKEISYHLGFKQASHFTKWFRRRSGLTPNDYRNQGSESWVFSQ